ncbi:MAG: DUF3343 domain-containing protein [Clostridia bacterium]|nr:DUF3343 domain-containing protein [Clostridia bacterium]
MKRYLATFHTHLAALMTVKSFASRGVEGRLAPVPRSVSSSCGTCMFYEAPDPMTDALDEDTEAVFETAADGSYVCVFENE